MTEDFEQIWNRVVQINDKYRPVWRDANPVYLSNALAGEVGEVCNITKKLAGGGSNNKSSLVELIKHLREEISDVLIYTIMLCENIKMGCTMLKTESNNKMDVIEERFKLPAKIPYNPSLGHLEILRYFGPDFNPEFCTNHDCECHTEFDFRVRVPFDRGNAYCCDKCAKKRKVP